MVEYIVLLLVFAVGYVLGKRSGWQAGFIHAEAATPLRLRQESMEHGQCIICHAIPRETIVETGE